MTENTAICNVKLSAAVNGGLAEVHLLPAGNIQGRDGHRWTLQSPNAVIDHFKGRKVDLPIDYEHRTERDLEAKSGPVPVAGWIKDLIFKPNGLWAKVEWTAKASEMIANKEYRYLSPVFRHTKSGNIMQMVSAGLVHSPNLLLTALSNEETNPMALTVEDMSKIAEAVGLGADAALDDVLGAITALATPDPAKYVPLDAVKEMVAEQLGKAQQRQEADIELKVSSAIERGHMPPVCVNGPSHFVGRT